MSTKNFFEEETMKNQNPLPETGFLRLKQIIGDPKADPPIPAILPISRSAFYDGISAGIYPRPVKLSARTSAWPVRAIRALIEQLAEGGDYV
jgi:prophage regulatory protein